MEQIPESWAKSISLLLNAPLSERRQLVELLRQTDPAQLKILLRLLGLEDAVAQRAASDDGGAPTSAAAHPDQMPSPIGEGAPQRREVNDQTVFVPKGENESGRASPSPVDETPTHHFDSQQSQAYRPMAGTKLAGRYELLDRLGTGGMGEVWLARQEIPVRRKVAIKLIRSGLETDSILHRFELERQALALMDHPSIAKVMDAGIASDGSPFFVMEYVEGETLNRFCETQKLSLTERLRLFIGICRAVQHAHQKGIVHRDLKPANILVTRVDGIPVPKIIDFGVAKAINAPLIDTGPMTNFGMLVGTLEYMSPEQTGSVHEDIDTRSDVYSLGVILYELLTGLRPFDREQFKKAALSEIVRLIREVDPSRPSTRYSSQGDLSHSSVSLRTDSRRLTAILRGELDWVVMKCLEKSRDRRYQTVEALARDLLKYLSNEPVEARPPSTWYRLQKLIRRNRVVAVALVLLTLSLAAGTAGTTIGMLEAQREARNADDQKTLAQAAEKAEAEQRLEAERSARRAFDALESYSDDVMTKLLGSRESLSQDELLVLERAQEQWQAFADGAGDSEQAIYIRAEGAVNLSLIQSRLGLSEQALANDRRGLQLREQLLALDPDNDDYQQRVATSHRNLAVSLRAAGNHEEAFVHIRSAVDQMSALAVAFPQHVNYANAEVECLMTLANILRDIGELAQAQASQEKALAKQENLASLNPANPKVKRSLARSYWGMADLHFRQRRANEAVEFFQKSIDIYQKLIGSVNETRTDREDVSDLRRQLGQALADSDRLAEGIEQTKLSIKEREFLVQRYPSIPSYLVGLGRAQRDLGDLLIYASETENALEPLLAAETVFLKLTSDNPSHADHFSDLGITQRFLAEISVELGKNEEAELYFTAASESLHRYLEADPRSFLGNRALNRVREHRGLWKMSQGDFQSAIRDFEDALKTADPNMQPIYRAMRTDALIRAGNFDEGLKEIASIEELDLPNPTHWYASAKLLVLASQNLPDRKAELEGRAFDFLQKAAELGFDQLERMENDPELLSLRTDPRYEAIRNAVSANQNTP